MKAEKTDYYKIGDISKMFNLSVQTLRFYERQGLFVPSMVSRETGYRYYSWEQFGHLRLIVFLRDLGLSLKDIKQQLGVQRGDEYAKLLEKYSVFLRSRIQSDTELKQYIDSTIESVKQARDLPQNKTLFRHFPELKILKYECVVGTFHDNEIAIADFMQKYRLKTNINRIGQLFSPESLINREGTFISTGLFVSEEMFTDETRIIAGESITVTPEGDYALMYYQKPTEESLPYISELLNDIAHHSYAPCGDVLRTIIYDFGRSEKLKDGYLACIRILVRRI